MLQFAIMVFLGKASVVFVGWCGSICTCIQNFCTNVNEYLNDFGICCWIEQIKQFFWFDLMDHDHIHDLWLVWVENFVVHEKCTLKYDFLGKFQSFYKYRSFGNVFVDSVVLGWLKPTKLCRIVKIMLQFAIMLFLGNANVVFVGWCGSIYTRFQNVCTNINKILNDFGFCCWIEQIKRTIWIWKNGARLYTRFMIGLSWKFCCSWKLRNQIWFFDSSFEVLKYTGLLLTLLLIVLYLADWNRSKFAKWSK